MQNHPIDFKYKLLWPYKYLLAPKDFIHLENNSISKKFINPNLSLKNNKIQDQITVSFFGDFMGLGNKFIYLDKDLSNFLNHSDKIVFNLESVVINTTGIILKRQYTHENVFLDFMSQLISNKVIVGLANNHLYDFGNEGVQETIKSVKKSGAHYIGTREIPKIELAKGLSIKASTCWYHPEDNIVNLYSNERDKDQVIHFLHWGEEFSCRPSPDQYLVLKELRENSISIIGHHSHAPQPIQEVNGLLTAFSLGNFATYFHSKKINNGLVLKVDYIMMNEKWYMRSCEWDFLHIQVEQQYVIIKRRGN